MSLYDDYIEKLEYLRQREGVPEELVESVETCRNCTACLEARQPIAPVAMDLQRAWILIVGRNPGNTEDRQAMPFVGPSGRVLFMWLTLAHVHLQDIAIVNLVPCHTQKDREPTPSEVIACGVHLRDTIKQMPQLKLIIALGSLVCSRFGVQGSISRVSGTILHTEQGYDVLPCIHPGSLTYDPLKWQSAENYIIKQLKSYVQLQRPYPSLTLHKAS